MLLSAAIFTLVIGAAVSAPHSNPEQRHMGRNIFDQIQTEIQSVYETMKQSYMCNWCVVGVEDGQSAIGGNLNQIGYILNRTSQLCEFCPAQDQCVSFFLNDIPAAIDDFLALNPQVFCGEAGLCDKKNDTLPDIVMNNMLRQRIRSCLQPEFMCETCQDVVSTTRDILMNNETQYDVMDFLGTFCEYLPTEYQPKCNEFVQNLPALMTMIAKDVLLDSTCTELGFCKNIKAEPTGIPDIGLNLFGINLDRGLPNVEIPGLGRLPDVEIPGLGRLPDVEIPGLGRLPNVEIPGLGRLPDIDIAGLGKNLFGMFGGSTQPGQGRPGYGQAQPGQGRPGYGQTQPGLGRPQQPVPNSKPRPQKPQPKPKPETPKEDPIPDINLQDIFGQVGIDLPDTPQLPNIRLPFRINFPGFGRKRRSVLEKVKDKIPDILPGLSLPEIVKPEGRVQQVIIPDPIPDAGVIVPDAGVIVPDTGLIVPDAGVIVPDAGVIVPDTGVIVPDAGVIVEQATGRGECDLCKMSVTAVENWLVDNAAQLQKMVSQVALPFCTALPSTLEQDCVSGVSNLVQNFIQILVSKLQPDRICTRLGQCDATATLPAIPDLPFVPSVEVPAVEPTTWPLLP